MKTLEDLRQEWLLQSNESQDGVWVERVNQLFKIAQLAHYTTCNHIGGAIDYYSVPKHEVDDLRKAFRELLENG